VPFDAGHLADEGDDERGVDGGGGQRLEPRQHLFAEPLPRGRTDWLGRARRHGRRPVRGKAVGRRQDERWAFDGKGVGEHARRAFAERHRRQLEWSIRRLGRGRAAHSRRYSRSRFVCDRLTGISVDFASLIFRM
jgi:hypothetical protein